MVKSKKIWLVIFKASLMPLVFGTLVFGVIWFWCARSGAYYSPFLDKILFTLTVLFITYWVFKIVVVLFDHYAKNIAANTAMDLDDKFIPLFKRIAVTIIWCICLIMILGRFGINMNVLVATLGVSSLAIALAAQDTISNIIAGFLIMVDRPFNTGDTIKLSSGEKVKVLDIGIRRCKFLAEDGSVVIMPNLQLSKSKISNYTYGEERAKNV